MKSKVMIIVAILTAIFLGLLLLGRKSAHAEISVEASPTDVWKVLTDVPRIANWNQVLVPTEGELAVGEKVTYSFYQDEDKGPAVMSAVVKAIIPLELLNQAGGMPLVMTFDHKYQLETVGDGTQVTIHEEYRGVMVPFWNPAPVERAYERLLLSLKQAVENE